MDAELQLKGGLPKSASAIAYAMMMRPNKAETPAQSCLISVRVIFTRPGSCNMCLPCLKPFSTITLIGNKSCLVLSEAGQTRRTMTERSEITNKKGTLFSRSSAGALIGDTVK